MRGWIAVSPVGLDDSSYDRRKEFRYDSLTPNHKRVDVHDLLFLRNHEQFLGVGRIHRIDSTSVDEVVNRCPVCNDEELAPRRSKSYRCTNGHTFATPATEVRTLVQYAAHFAYDFVAFGARVEASETRPFELTNRRHLGLRGADLNGLAHHLAGRDYKVAETLKLWLGERNLMLPDQEGDAPQNTKRYELDDRDRPLSAIRQRRGPENFRNLLIQRYGACCLISRCKLLPLLEAANIQPAQSAVSFKPANGLLLRSDLHTLFDLDLIGISPTSLTVGLHPDLIGTEYESFAGAKLHVAPGKEPNARALVSRWSQFRMMRERSGPRFSLTEIAEEESTNPSPR